MELDDSGTYAQELDKGDARASAEMWGVAEKRKAGDPNACDLLRTECSSVMHRPIPKKPFLCGISLGAACSELWEEEYHGRFSPEGVANVTMDQPHSGSGSVDADAVTMGASEDTEAIAPALKRLKYVNGNEVIEYTAIDMDNIAGAWMNADGELNITVRGGGDPMVSPWLPVDLSEITVLAAWQGGTPLVRDQSGPVGKSSQAAEPAAGETSGSGAQSRAAGYDEKHHPGTAATWGDLKNAGELVFNLGVELDSYAKRGDRRLARVLSHGSGANNSVIEKIAGVNMMSRADGRPFGSKHLGAPDEEQAAFSLLTSTKLILAAKPVEELAELKAIQLKRSLADAYSNSDGLGLSPACENLLLTLLAAAQRALESGFAPGTRRLDKSYWKFWTQFCVLMGTSPLRTNASANCGAIPALHNREVALATGAFMSYVANNPRLKIESMLSRLRGVVRMHKRLGIQFVSLAHVAMAARGLVQEHIDAHGTEFLETKSKEPLTTAEIVGMLSLPQGTKVGELTVGPNVEWQGVRVTLALGATMAPRIEAFAIGQDEEFGPRKLSLDHVTYKLGGEYVRIPTAEQLANPKIGDMVFIIPCPCKNDGDGSKYGGSPIPSAFHPTRVINLAREVFTYELLRRVEPGKRKVSPFILGPGNRSWTKRAFSAFFAVMIGLVATPARAKILKYHGMRAWLACALRALNPPATPEQIMLFLRWSSDTARRLYSRPSVGEHTRLLDSAQVVSFEVIRSHSLIAQGNALRLNASQIPAASEPDSGTLQIEQRALPLLEQRQVAPGAGPSALPFLERRPSATQLRMQSARPWSPGVGTAALSGCYRRAIARTYNDLALFDRPGPLGKRRAAQNDGGFGFAAATQAIQKLSPGELLQIQEEFLAKAAQQMAIVPYEQLEADGIQLDDDHVYAALHAGADKIDNAAALIDEANRKDIGTSDEDSE